MEKVNFCSRTRLVLSDEAELQCGTLIKPFSDNVLIVLGGDFIKETSWYSKLLDNLVQNKIEYYELSGIKPNPTVEVINKGIQICVDHDIHFILSIGGGSAIDTAKSISLLPSIPQDKDLDAWPFFTGHYGVKKTLPVGCVMTIMSTGSEASNGAVVTNPVTQEKLDVMSDDLRPMFCVMNPYITNSLPKHQLECGIADMFSHVLERYISKTEGTVLTDSMGEAIMRTIIVEAINLEKDLFNYSARANLMLASLFAHNDLVGMDRSQEWTTHTIAAPLSGVYNIVHGETISIIMPKWAEYVEKSAIKQFAKLGKNVFGINNHLSEENIASEAIRQLTLFFKRLNMPTTLKEVKIEETTKFDLMADLSLARSTNGTIGNIQPLTKEDIINIYKDSL